MRIFVTSLMAFFISGLAGGLVAQQLAVWSNAQEEFIVVFLASALMTIIVTIVFFIVQFPGNQPRVVNLTGAIFTGILAILGIALVVWSLSLQPPNQMTGKDMTVVVGLILPGLVTELVHWAFVRWRQVPKQFAGAVA